MTDAAPPLARLAAAFGAIYFVWGSTFLAIRFAVAEIPPFMMAGVRFLAAGMILYLWRRLVHAERPGRGHWAGAALIGALLFLGGNGSVVWSIQRVPSGLVALMLATIPLWMVLLDAMGRGVRPNGRVMAGVILGLSGLGILLGPSTLLGAGRVDLPGAAVLMAGSICWATGSLVSRRIRQASSHALAAGMQMMIGGVILLLVSLAAGEMHRLEPASVTSRALLALAYLVFFGSVISFTAYTWLLSVTSPARVSTYAFVNPVVAVLLGWALAGEPLTARTLIALVVIVTAVAMIIATNAGRAGARAR